MTDTAALAPDASPDAALEARRRILADSGWGASFRVIQPRNFTFWVMVFLFVVGAPATIRGFRAAADTYTGAFVEGIVWFSLFAAGFLWLFSRLDRYSRLPGKAKVVAFLFSGLVATFAMAALNNDAFRSILRKAVSPEFMIDWGAGVTAPWSEEIAKLLPVVLLLGLAPRVMRCAFDGLIIGAISGLAFQVFEDVAYVYGSAASNFGETSFGTQTLGLRTILGVTGHWTWSGVAGAGLIFLLGRHAEPPRRLLGLALIFSSMLFHFTWDSIGGLTGGASWAIGIYPGLTIVNLAVFIWTYRHTVSRERQWARDLLAPEVALGVLSEEEVEAAVASRKQRRHFIHASANHRSTRHVLEAARDLADEIAEAQGLDTPDVEHARSEIARLRA